MALTYTQLKDRVARKTIRSVDTLATNESTRFDLIVKAGLDDILQQAGLLYDFKEMYSEDTITIVEDDYRSLMPTSIRTGFSSAVNHLYDALIRETTSPTQTYEFFVKSQAWLDTKYPDRSRTDAPTARPMFGARIGGYFHWQAPADGSYTLTLRTTHLPDGTLFTSGTTSTTNPIAALDSALVAFAIGEVFDSLGSQLEADRQKAIAYNLVQLAIESQGREPARIFRAEPRPENPSGGFSVSTLDFDAENLATQAYMNDS